MSIKKAQSQGNITFHMHQRHASEVFKCVSRICDKPIKTHMCKCVINPAALMHVKCDIIL